MLGEIIEIRNNVVVIKRLGAIDNNVINLFVKIKDAQHTFVGEIMAISKEKLEILLVGELINQNFIYGINQKPSFEAKIELMPKEEINILFGGSNYEHKKSLYLGKSAIYPDIFVFANINELFSSHMVVLGNTGSGKSCGVARLLQNLFYKKELSANKATFFIIDAYGEYQSAFEMIDAVNKDLTYKSYTSNVNGKEEILSIPLWLMGLDDICLLLGVNDKNQIPIVEKALKLLNIFSRQEEEVMKYKNSIIAKSLLDIFVSGNTPAQIRDQIFSVLTRYNTPELNLETKVYLPGYVRPLKQCLMIDETGKIHDMQLVVDFLSKYVLDEMNLSYPDGSYRYTLKDLLYAFDFALMDEGLFSNRGVYNLANELRVRLSMLVDSEYSSFFELPDYISKEEFFNELINKGVQKTQVININLNYVDDRFAKVIAKIYSKFLFDYAKNELPRAEMPLHIVLEEAHRYVQNDNDVEILGYNIFERISKEGRKYAVLLNLISQRPSELSSTVLSQCSNFLVFKINHPIDVDYVKTMIPFINEDIIEKMKNLQTGSCLTFGKAFLIPTIVKMDLPTPAPTSTSCEISEKWF